MIIDFTRKFTQQEYDLYQDIVDRWWLQYDINQREILNSDSDDIVSPTAEEWNNLIMLGVLDDAYYLIKTPELLWLNDLQKYTDNIVEHLKKFLKFSNEFVWPDSCDKRANIFRWLEDRDIYYFLVKHAKSPASFR